MLVMVKTHEDRNSRPIGSDESTFRKNYTDVGAKKRKQDGFEVYFAKSVWQDREW